jgi:16S rRNA C967 or C1407 C5-methylase (RsmB/RsmF family)
MLQLPELFVQRMTSRLGGNSQAFFRSLEDPVPVSIRMNTRKPFDGFEGMESVPWCASGFYLKQRHVFTLDPFFHAGCYYVQEASSMFIERAYRNHGDLQRSLRVLDLCAAPGGKSTHLLSLLPEDSLLVSNEPIPSRNAILRDNLSKWGYENVVVTQNEPGDFKRLTGFFDMILVDAPCSGEGLFRKNHEAVREWSESNLSMCSTRQHSILEDVLPSLKPGGLLIYSTCTYNDSENDDICEILVKGGSMDPLELEPAYGAAKTRTDSRCIRIWSKVKGFSWLRCERNRLNRNPIPSKKRNTNTSNSRVLGIG